MWTPLQSVPLAYLGQMLIVARFAWGERVFFSPEWDVRLGPAIDVVILRSQAHAMLMEQTV